MVFIKHNSLTSDIDFNPIFITCFSGSRFVWVQVFLGTGFSGYRFFRVRVQGPGLEVAVLHQRRIHLYLSLGMKLTKADRVSDWLKKHIDFNTDKRKHAANSFKESFLTDE